MDGMHDLGGMDGFGPVLPEPNEPVFHASWEASIFGLSQAMTAPGNFSVDMFRYLGELPTPVEYLTWSYYERWYFIAAMALLRAGMVTPAELREGRAAPGTKRREDAMAEADVPAAIAESGKCARPVATAPLFALGQQVRTRNLHPTGHTRLPRYARGKIGTVHRLCGGYVFPDTNASGLGENPQHLYTIAIPARELWGPDAAAKDKVYFDFWESYLEPVK
ncbi:MAG: nitrile hydratase subunit beta [Dongiaceae bacterium]